MPPRKKAERLTEEELHSDKKNNKHRRDEELRDFVLKITKGIIVVGLVFTAIWGVLLASRYVITGNWVEFKNDGIKLIKYGVAYLVGLISKTKFLSED